MASGDLLANCIFDVNHTLCERRIVTDDVDHIRAAASHWIANSSIKMMVLTDGSEFSGHDSKPKAVMPLFDNTIDSFGEFFRAVSYDEIGKSAIQPPCVGERVNRTLIFWLTRF
jgi:molybdenum cofactor biosynthesis protein B